MTDPLFLFIVISNPKKSGNSCELILCSRHRTSKAFLESLASDLKTGRYLHAFDVHSRDQKVMGIFHNLVLDREILHVGKVVRYTSALGGLGLKIKVT